MLVKEATDDLTDQMGPVCESNYHLICDWLYWGIHSVARVISMLHPSWPHQTWASLVDLPPTHKACVGRKFFFTHNFQSGSGFQTGALGTPTELTYQLISEDINYHCGEGRPFTICDYGTADGGTSMVYTSCKRPSVSALPGSQRWGINHMATKTYNYNASWTITEKIPSLWNTV